MARKIVLYDWIFHTDKRGLWSPVEESPRQERIREMVRRELANLPFEEREFVEQYWFQGISTQELSRLWGKKEYKLESLNRRIMRKLRNALAKFVQNEFGLDGKEQGSCLICSHPRRDAIDRLLKTKKPEETFKPIIATLKSDYHLIIKTPQVIIGHIKYHLREEQ